MTSKKYKQLDMDKQINTNSSRDSLRSYLRRFSSIFTIYGIVAFYLGGLFAILPGVTVLGAVVYAITVFVITVFLVVITFGVGLVFLFNEMILPLWSALGDLNPIYEKSQELSEVWSPIILGISIGLLVISIILYVFFEDRRKTKKIVHRSIYAGLSLVLLISFLTGTFSIWS